MKKKLARLSIIFALSSIYFMPAEGFSQGTGTLNKSAKSDTAHSFVKLAKITKFYTKEELNKLPKLELIEVYKSRLVYLIEILPFMSLHPEPGATFHDMSIPETEANIAHLEKESKNKESFVKSLSTTLDDVIPYSEKTNIIWSILFFEEMIKKSDYIDDKKSK